MTTVFIISAPSGSGKSTLVARLLASVPGLMFSVSYTTRPPRGHEVDGESYHFVSRDGFRSHDRPRRVSGMGGGFRQLLRHAPRHPGARPRPQGKDLVLDIDVQGARQLKSRIPEAVTVFILAPSRQILEQRLRARGEDREEVIERRLAGRGRRDPELQRSTIMC